MLRRTVIVGSLVAVVLVVVSPGAEAGQWIFEFPVFRADGSHPQIAMNAAGDAVIVFEGFGQAIHASFRPADGDFSDLPFGEAVSAEDSFLQPEAPAVAIDPAGDVIVVWQQSGGGAGPLIYAAFKPAGGQFSVPSAISPEGASAPAVAMGAHGEATVAWLLNDGTNEIVQAATASPGGLFSSPAALSGDGGNAASDQVAMDPQGATVVSWTRTSGSSTELEAAIRSAGSASFPAPDGAGDGSLLGESEPGSTDTPTEAPVQRVVMDQSGGAVAVWKTTSNAVQEARLAPGGTSFGPAVTLGSTPDRPSIAMNEVGEAVAVWPAALGVEVAAAAPGGAFKAPEHINPVGETPEVARVTVTPTGAADVVWESGNKPSADESFSLDQEGILRAPGGGFENPSHVFGYADATFPLESLEVAGDSAGDLLGVWEQDQTNGDEIGAFAYDNGPVLVGVTVPTSGQTGQALSFSMAPPLSTWAPLNSITWTFGDGTTASGLSATHSYTQPGVYQVTATATDTQPYNPPREDVATSLTRTVTITAPTGASLTGVSPTATSPEVAAVGPIISDLAQAHPVWREGTRLAHDSARTDKPPVGTTFSFTLNEPGQVTFTFTQRLGGREVNGQCTTPTSSNHRKRTCKRTLTLGTLSFTGHTDRNTLYFQGRLSPQKRLKLGRYVVALQATDTAGQRSASHSLMFTIVK
jgi:hypothetical protein